MKLFAALVALTLSASAFALDNEAIVKILDGKGARCVATRDLNHRAYLASAISAQNEPAALSVAFRLQHFSCAQGRAGFVWESAHPLDPYQDLDLKGRPITVKLSQSQAVVVRSGDAGILSATDLDNGTEHIIRFSAGVTDLLSASEQSALEAGAAVDARATFFVRSLVSVQTAEGETVNLGLRAGGAYTIFLTLKRDAAGAVQVVAARLN